MSSRTLINLLMFAAVLALGLVTYLEPGRTPAPAVRHLTELTPAAIGDIVIERVGTPQVRLVRRDGQWRLDAPLQARANRYRIEAILGLASAVSLAQLPAAGVDLKQLGLDPPRVQVRLGTVELAVGGTEALDNRRYVRAGETVHLVDDLYYRHLVASPVELVDPALLDPHAKPLGIVLPELSLQLVDGRWILTPPDPAISADAVAALVERWRHASAIELSSCETQPDAAPPHWAEVRLADASTPLRWQIRGEGAELVLCRPDLKVAYHFPKQTGEALLALDKSAPGPAAGGSDTGN